MRGSFHDGDRCPKFGPDCCGRLAVELDGECTCAVLGRMAPCAACSNSYLICDDCGWDSREKVASEREAE